MQSNLSFVETHAARWLVPLLLGTDVKERLLGSGVLVRHQRRLFLLTAAHVLFDDDGRQWDEEVWFVGPLALRDAATQEIRLAHLRIEPKTVVRLPHADVAFVPLRFVDSATHEAILGLAFDLDEGHHSDALNANGTGDRPFVVGFPGELAYSDPGRSHFLQPVSVQVQLSHPDVSLYGDAVQAAPGELVGWVSIGRHVDEEGRATTPPSLSAVSGGAWVRVTGEGDSRKVQLLGLHRGTMTVDGHVFALGSVLPQP